MPSKQGVARSIRAGRVSDVFLSYFMRVFKLIIITVLILSIVIYLGIYGFVWAKGNAILSSKLEELIGRKVSIGSLYIIPLYSVCISDLRIEGLLSVDKIRIEPSIAGLLAGKLGLNKLFLSNPVFNLVRIDEKTFNISQIIDSIKSKRSGSEKKSSVNFFVKEAIVEEGEIEFYDETVDLYFAITPLDMSVITSLKDFKTRINLEAQVLSSNKKEVGDISAAGWMNILKKDMDAIFYLDNLEVVYFSPYFKKIFKNIKSGKLFFSADMVSRSNDLTVDCHLETRGLKFSDEESIISDTQEDKFALFGNISGIVLDTLIGPRGGGIFDFSIRTKFDRPRLEGLQLKGNIFQAPIANIFKRGPEEGIDTIKKIGKDFEAIGKEFKEQFKDIGDIFKKQIEDVGSLEPQEATVDPAASE